jgi:uncharacterized protein YfdQ (DUF2303 family)
MENIELIQNTAVAAAGQHLLRLPSMPDGIVLTGDQKVQSLEPFQLQRARYRGQLRTNSLADFASYVKAAVPAGVAQAVGFVNVEKMAATVYFNLGTVDQPGHGDWMATLTMQATAAFSAMLAIDGKKFGQAELIEWLEDWSDVLVADFDSSVDIARNTNTLTKAIAALRKLKITAKGESTHNHGDFKGSSSTLEEVEASSQDVLPIGFRLAAEPYEGLSLRSFFLKLSVLTGGDKPQLVLRWKRKESQIEEIAREFKHVLGDQLGEVTPLTIGTFSP